MSGPIVQAVQRATARGAGDSWTLYLPAGPLHTALSCDKWMAQAPHCADFYLSLEAARSGARTALHMWGHEL